MKNEIALDITLEKITWLIRYCPDLFCEDIIDKLIVSINDMIEIYDLKIAMGQNDESIQSESKLSIIPNYRKLLSKLVKEILTLIKIKNYKLSDILNPLIEIFKVDPLPEVRKLWLFQ